MKLFTHFLELLLLCLIVIFFAVLSPYHRVAEVPSPPVSVPLVSVKDSIFKLSGNQAGCTAFQVKGPSSNTYILTAKHCKDILNEGLSGTITLQNQATIQRKMIAEDQFSDLLLLEAAPGIVGLEVAKYTFPGEKIKLLGYGYMYPLWEVSATIITDSKFLALFPLDYVQTIISAEPAPGHSGSPALDSDNHVIGVVSTGIGGVGGIVRLQDLQSFLKGY